MKSLLYKIATIGILLLSFQANVFAAPPINTLSGGLFDRQTGTAIRGYDPVAYFTDNKPVKGKDDFSTDWDGAKWLFASKANLDLFKANPQKYAPQYGGYCAYGVAVDNLVSIEPDKFTIINGKLYLNYDADVQSTWRKSPEKYIADADKKFNVLLKK
ncbi:YHS domain-containing protein [Polynucleobacter sp. JS-Safj-400b-B2]|uniref:YHS domain-containing (seleno)protein n=1 Tax=Polynucleobacter sp. JS-Safj-400b-B2 TaxID=2576921 RepID=UPI001C0DF1F5|nr:YHS domain-containing (seleno)protein [Polynucleobacter sp. JS-Safj-400b-B2]MBU3626872.1 YHS domain-containing protein [Polynucleobacter sp. JS-Safj-400b-B2]